MNKEKFVAKIISILVIFSLVLSTTAVSFASTSTEKYAPRKVITTSVGFNGNNELVIKWKKINKNCSGYQIQYADNNSFKNANRVTLKSKSTASKKIKNIRNVNDSFYYVHIRAYNKVNGKVYYGKWSTTKCVSTKSYELYRNFSIFT